MRGMPSVTTDSTCVSPEGIGKLGVHWEGLRRFVDDPRIPMDNNTSERLERGPAVARKNFYGSGSLWSGQLMAALFSILGHGSKAGHSSGVADVDARRRRPRSDADALGARWLSPAGPPAIPLLSLTKIRVLNPA